MVQRAYMGADDMMSEWMDVEPAHMGMDMEYMDTGLMAETTYYGDRVSAMNSVGTGEMSDGYGKTSWLPYAAANTAPTAGRQLLLTMTVKAGQTSNGHGRFRATITDADTDDTLTWSAMSNMPIVRHRSRWSDMGMVTITGVTAGMATITVTATDMGVGAGMMNRMTAMQTIDGNGGSGGYGHVLAGYSQFVHQRDEQCQ